MDIHSMLELETMLNVEPIKSDLVDTISSQNILHFTKRVLASVMYVCESKRNLRKGKKHETESIRHIKCR